MKEQSLDALIVTSTDEFLNEYVDKEISPRTYISGFDGTAGDLIITIDKAYLIVDGRYHIQAEKQVDKTFYCIEKAGIDLEGNRINEYIHERMLKVLEMLSFNHNEMIIGFDSRQISFKMASLLNKNTEKFQNKVILTPLDYNPVSKIMEKSKETYLKPVYYVPEEITGLSSIEKLSAFRGSIFKQNIDAYFISKLDELSYLTNLRGMDIDYNSTFKGYAFITDKEAFLFTDLKRFSCQNLTKISDGFDVSPINKMFDFLKSYLERQTDGFKIGFDPSSTNYFNYLMLKNLTKKRFKLISEIECPIKRMKSIKNSSEIKYFKNCINIADRVFDVVINWLNDSINSGKAVTEYDLKNQVEKTFKDYGAERLSFDTIAAAGSNSAIIHYTDSSKERTIKTGELVLIDAGAYFTGGYATDLTRTVLAGGKNTEINYPKMKTIYTIVIKAGIKGLMAELPPDSTGKYLDNIVRSIIKEAGYDYNHGTGHGIGILVHEAPPSISPTASDDIKLKKGMIFSIEPGIYIENVGGVRFENIATLISHTDKEKAENGWLEVKTLSFSPIDYNLIETDMLDENEKLFLRSFNNNYLEICNHLN